MSDLPHGADVKITIYFRKPTSAGKGYISAYSGYPTQPGEHWHRGNDLSDGEYSEETLNRVKRDIHRIFKKTLETPKN